ncbi:MAG: AAA family ATPase, partial [bacterium]|nr:AAA family ATPase [bacterium]
IAEVIADWTGIPVARVSNGEEARLLEMEHLLQGRVIGQDHAVAAVASTIRVVRVGLSSPNRPAGVFMFLGPSGVGKTELAKTLAEFLFGSEHEMVRLDMSEFHDKHSVARLIGAPPGYVGYEGEGQLTKALRTRPFCVLLLDEVEKAHPDIFDIFLQVFDDGRLTDAKGHTVNFTNAIIIMTSNLGARSAYKEAQMRALQEKQEEEEEELSAAAAGDGPELKSHSAGIIAPHTDTGVVGQMDSLPSAYQNALLEHFRPEFLNRIDEIVVFRTLSRENMRGIVDINLRKSIKRVKENRQVEIDIDPAAVDFILDKGYHPEFGARPLNRAIDTWLTRPFAEYFLRNKIMPGTHVKVECAGDKLTFQSVSKAFKGDTMDGEDNPRNAAAGAPNLSKPAQPGSPYGMQSVQPDSPYGAQPAQPNSPYGGSASPPRNTQGQGALPLNPYGPASNPPPGSKVAGLGHLPIARKNVNSSREASDESRAALRESLGRISPNLIPKKEELSRSKEQYQESSEFGGAYNAPAPEPSLPASPSALNNAGPQEVAPGQWPSRGPAEPRPRNPEVRRSGPDDLGASNPFGHRPPDNNGSFDPAPFGKGYD